MDTDDSVGNPLEMMPEHSISKQALKYIPEGWGRRDKLRKRWK